MVQTFSFQNQFKVNIANDTYKSLSDSIIGISLPSLTLGTIGQPTPIKPIFLPNEVIEFENLTLTFLLDENFGNWKQIFEWINYLKNFHTLDGHRLVTDISINVLDNKLKYQFTIGLEDCFPVTLSELELSSQIIESEPVTFNSTFIVNNFYIDMNS